jgi:hypothetical protein
LGQSGEALSVTFRILDTSEVGRAHAWHAGFAAANDAIFRRTEQEFYDLALDRCLWCAITEEDEILAISYIHATSGERSIEVGGLMVAVQTRGQGIGEAMMRFPLIHFLANERPLRWSPRPTIVAHVLAGNDGPLKIIEGSGFRHFKTDTWPPGGGLRTGPDGMVHGDEFHFDPTNGLEMLAQWVGAWSGALKNGTAAEVKLLEGESIADWPMLLRSM